VGLELARERLDVASGRMKIQRALDGDAEAHDAEPDEQIQHGRGAHREHERLSLRDDVHDP
jgi:hypothetical protein